MGAGGAGSLAGLLSLRRRLLEAGSESDFWMLTVGALVADHLFRRAWVATRKASNDGDLRVVASAGGEEADLAFGPGARKLAAQALELPGEVFSGSSGDGGAVAMAVTPLGQNPSVLLACTSPGDVTAPHKEVVSFVGQTVELVAARGNRLHDVLLATVAALAQSVEKRDAYTASHQASTVGLSLAIARRLGLGQDSLECLRQAAALHDIGKVAVPLQILTKPTKLSAAELALVREHAAHGYDILKEVPFRVPVAETVLQHHERLDGSGYPRGLKGSEILLEARIVAVADVIDSVAADRPYRKALGPAQARAILSDGAGTLFDPAVVDAARDLIDGMYR